MVMIYVCYTALLEERFWDCKLCLRDAVGVCIGCPPDLVSILQEHSYLSMFIHSRKHLLSPLSLFVLPRIQLEVKLQLEQQDTRAMLLHNMPQFLPFNKHITLSRSVRVIRHKETGHVYFCYTSRSKVAFDDKCLDCLEHT